MENMLHRLKVKWFLRKNVFDAAAFENKRVLIIGPAEGVENEIGDLSFSDFDYIVKLNNGVNVALRDKLHKDSWRCDILFHSMSSDLPPPTACDLERASVKIIVHRTPAKKYLLETLRHVRNFRKNRSLAQIRYIDPSRYAALKACLGGYSPSTGLVAIDFFLGCETSRLSIVGFTFFSTKYVPGYRDTVLSNEDAANRVAAAGHHNPEGERRFVAARFAGALEAGRVIHLGSTVAGCLELA